MMLRRARRALQLVALPVRLPLWVVGHALLVPLLREQALRAKERRGRAVADLQEVQAELVQHQAAVVELRVQLGKAEQALLRAVATRQAQEAVASSAMDVAAELERRIQAAKAEGRRDVTERQPPYVLAAVLAALEGKARG